MLDAFSPMATLLLAYVLLFLPAMSLAGRRRQARARAAGVEPGQTAPRDVRLPSRSRAYVSTLIQLTAMFVLARIVAREYWIDLFVWPPVQHGPLPPLACAAAAALFLLLLRFLHRAMRREAESRTLPVLRWLPRTRRERTLYSAMAIAAGIVEEIAYRGVIVHLLTLATGSTAFAIAVSAAAFTLAHSMQGWKSMFVVLQIALTMHALVALTGTLVLAMVVHALYDIAVPLLARERIASTS